MWTQKHRAVVVADLGGVGTLGAGEEGGRGAELVDELARQVGQQRQIGALIGLAFLGPRRAAGAAVGVPLLLQQQVVGHRRRVAAAAAAVVVFQNELGQPAAQARHLIPGPRHAAHLRRTGRNGGVGRRGRRRRRRRRRQRRRRRGGGGTRRRRPLPRVERLARRRVGRRRFVGDLAQVQHRLEKNKKKTKQKEGERSIRKKKANKKVVPKEKDLAEPLDLLLDALLLAFQLLGLLDDLETVHVLDAHKIHGEISRTLVKENTENETKESQPGRRPGGGAASRRRPPSAPGRRRSTGRRGRRAAR